MLTSLEIARNAKKEHITEIAAKLGIDRKYLTIYGDYIAKIEPGIIENPDGVKKGKYILVTAMTPTLLGEGKTVTTIGLSMALNKLGEVSTVCLRQPSLGPVFGIKGGGSGGGYSQVLPMQDVNLHFTGDSHAVGTAHNLAAAFLDNTIFHGNKHNLALDKIYWQRVIDINDRYLRNVRSGIGLKSDSIVRDTGFDITAASEVMAILALCRDKSDLRRRLSNIVLAESCEGIPVTAEDIKVAGSMAVLLKDAVKPNLIQTVENTPCIMHTGPFANIAHGNSSIIADRIALAHSDFVVTESGFGADCGAEKFFDIKCRVSGLIPDAVVIVCTIRALKVHSGRFKLKASGRLPKELCVENIPAIEEGLGNLQKHIENVKCFGIPAVVAINRFEDDTDGEIDFVRNKVFEFGADDCQVSTVWRDGSSGGIKLAESIIKAAVLPKNFNFLYPLEASIKDKIKTIATRMYGARDVEYSVLAEEKIEIYNRHKWDVLPICMAKTQLSLSHDPVIKGRPGDFILPVKDIRASIGAGFLYPLCGVIRTMPGLPKMPVGEKIDTDADDNITGLS